MKQLMLSFHLLSCTFKLPQATLITLHTTLFTQLNYRSDFVNLHDNNGMFGKTLKQIALLLVWVKPHCNF